MAVYGKGLTSAAATVARPRLGSRDDLRSAPAASRRDRENLPKRSHLPYRKLSAATRESSASKK